MKIIAKSIGKTFEQNWKNSCPENIFVYRPPDAAQSFNMGNNLRFSQRSPCDFFIYNGLALWTLELKTVSGISISFERNENDNGIIHYYQIKSLKKFATYKNIISGLIIDFRKSEHTYFFNINEWDQLVNSISKKSFNEKDLQNYCSPISIEKKKLKVNYRYNILKFLQDSQKLFSK